LTSGLAYSEATLRITYVNIQQNNAGLKCDDTQHSIVLCWGSAKANGREPETCLGRVFNNKLGCFDDVHETHLSGHMPTSIVENSAQA
jgi:hypothetical protein